VNFNLLVAMTTTHISDFASGLKQVLDDGPNTSTYGNSCLAQVSNAGTEYLLETRWAMWAN
jgi:hypothetical protein